MSLPNGQIIAATHTGTFVLASIGASISAYVFPDDVLLHNLLSFSALCDLDCTVTLTSADVTVTHAAVLVFRGTKLASDSLWLIDLL